MKRRDKAVSSRLAIPWNSPQSLFNYTGQIVPVYSSAESRHHRAGEITWGVRSGLYCSVQNKKLKLKFFSSRPLPCHSSPLSLFSFFLLIDLTQRLSGKGLAPGYKHPRSVVLCPWWFTTLQEPWCRCILFYHARVFPFSFTLYLFFFRFPFSLITMEQFLSNF